eukprot:gene21892-16348_t
MESLNKVLAALSSSDEDIGHIVEATEQDIEQLCAS